MRGRTASWPPGASSPATWAHRCWTLPAAANTTSCSASTTAGACGPGWTPSSPGAWLARVGELLEADRGLQQLTGMETWFKCATRTSRTMKPPPRWKMWLISLVAVYPLVLAFQAVAVPRMTGLPLPLRALLFPLVLLTLMTFVCYSGGDPGAAPLARPTTGRMTAHADPVRRNRRAVRDRDGPAHPPVETQGITLGRPVSLSTLRTGDPRSTTSCNSRRRDRSRSRSSSATPALSR